MTNIQNFEKTILDSTKYEFPIGWCVCTFPDAVEINPSQPECIPDDSDMVSFLPMAAVEAISGRLNLSDIRSWGRIKKGYKRFQEGDVIFAKITPSMENGKGSFVKDLVGGVGAGSTEFHVFRPSDIVLGEFFFYFIIQEGFRKAAKSKMTGTAGQLRVPASFLECSHLPLPPKAEQIRIVEEIESYLTRLDDSVVTLERTLRNLKRYRESVLKSAMEGSLVSTEAEIARIEARAFEPASDLLERILAERRLNWEKTELAKMVAKGKVTKNDDWKAKYKEPVQPEIGDLPELPEGWCWSSLDAIAEIKGGLTKGKKRGPSVILKEIPFLRVANVQRGYLDLSDVRKIQATEDETNLLALRKGDVLFNEGGDRDKLGRGWIWEEELPVCIHQNHVFRARLLLADIQAKFISWYGNSKGMEYFMAHGKQTTNLASINLTKLRKLPIPIPPVREQLRIVHKTETLFSVADHSIIEVESNLGRCRRLRQSILNWAFIGKLVDQDSADEPAATILAQIKAEKKSLATNRKTKSQRKIRKA